MSPNGVCLSCVWWSSFVDKDKSPKQQESVDKVKIIRIIKQMLLS